MLFLLEGDALGVKATIPGTDTRGSARDETCTALFGRRQDDRDLSEEVRGTIEQEERPTGGGMELLGGV